MKPHILGVLFAVAAVSSRALADGGATLPPVGPPPPGSPPPPLDPAPRIDPPLSATVFRPPPSVTPRGPRNRPLMIGGAVTFGVFGAGGTAMIVAASYLDCPFLCGATVPLLLGGAASLAVSFGVGLPMLVVGSQREGPTVSLGPTSATFRVPF